MHTKTQETVRELAAMHRQRNEMRQIQAEEDFRLRRSTPLLDFCDMIRSLGGEYKILRPEEKKKKHTSGRRESRLLMRWLEVKVNGILKYRMDHNGSVRRVLAK